MDFLDSHPGFKECVLNKKHNEQILADEWDELVAELNCIIGAPSLPKDTWQSRFKYWRYDLLDKQRKIVLEANATGGGKSTAKPLKDFEKRALSLFNPVTTTGNPMLLSEAGIEQQFVIPPQIYVVDDVANEEVIDHSSSNPNFLQGNDSSGLENISPQSPPPLIKRKSNTQNGSSNKRQRFSQTELFLQKMEEIEQKKAEQKQERELRETERQEASTAAIVRVLGDFAQSINNLATAVVMNQSSMNH